jgi:hypothetical protein
VPTSSLSTKTRFVLRIAETSDLGSSTFPNFRAPVGQISTHAGIRPSRVR